MKTLIDIEGEETGMEVLTKKLEEFKIEVGGKDKEPLTKHLEELKIKDREKGKKALKKSLEESIKERVCFLIFPNFGLVFIFIYLLRAILEI